MNDTVKLIKTKKGIVLFIFLKYSSYLKAVI